jgi:hypothetical protein
MEVSVKIFNDAAKAIDKLANVLGKLAKALVEGAGTTIKLVDYSASRRAHKMLIKVTRVSATLHVRQATNLTASVQDFLDDPTPSRWQDVQREFRAVDKVLKVFSKDLDKASPIIAAEPFFVELLKALRSREYTLNKITELPYPSTAEEMKAAKKLLNDYTSLVSSLSTVLKELQKYTSKSKSWLAWPKLFGQK